MAESPTAIVTGGACGLGAAFSVALLQKGYRVCISDVLEEKGNLFAKQQQEKYGNKNVRFIVCDVTNEEDYTRLFDFALKEFKRIDLVLNNAGIICEQNARKTIEVNLMGPIIGCQLALKYMGKSNGGKGGMVINTASILGLLPCYAMPVYAASKHGVVGLTRSYGASYHFDRDGVLFAAICPFYTNTDILKNCDTSTLVPDFDQHKKYQLMTPEYVAQGILKLLEDRINGSTLLVTKDAYKYIGYQEELKDALATES